MNPGDIIPQEVLQFQMNKWCDWAKVPRCKVICKNGIREYSKINVISGIYLHRKSEIRLYPHGHLRSANNTTEVMGTMKHEFAHHLYRHSAKKNMRRVGILDVLWRILNAPGYSNDLSKTERLARKAESWTVDKIIQYFI